jgi:acetyl esterase/lipase
MIARRDVSIGGGAVALVPSAARAVLRWGKAATLSLLAVTACSPLRIFNNVMPKDSGSRLVLRGAAFGADPRQRLDIYAPTTPSARPWPVIVFIYGGSWNSGMREGYGFVGRALASRGFLVAIPDYRLVPRAGSAKCESSARPDSLLSDRLMPKTGTHFLARCSGVRYPAFLEDNAAAVHWVIAHAAQYHGDPQRLVLAGHSAGAYDAAMLAYDPRWLGGARAAVRAMIGLAGPYDFLPSNLASVNAAFGGASDPADTQPINHVSPGAVPALLCTGDKDDLVAPRNSDTLAARLQAAGTPVERLRYPSVGHVGLVTAIAEPFRRNAPVLDDMASFARRYTQ